MQLGSLCFIDRPSSDGEGKAAHDRHRSVAVVRGTALERAPR